MKWGKSCPSCNGSGEGSDNGYCPHCGGDGGYEDDDEMGDEGDYRYDMWADELRDATCGI